MTQARRRLPGCGSETGWPADSDRLGRQLGRSPWPSVQSRGAATGLLALAAGRARSRNWLSRSARPRRAPVRAAPGRSASPPGPAVKTVSSVPAIRARTRQLASSGRTTPSRVSGPCQPHAALPAPQRAQLPAVRLHVAIEFPRVVGNLDVDRREARVVPFRFAAKVHKHLSGKSEPSPSV